jgi:hypothetical protein
MNLYTQTKGPFDKTEPPPQTSSWTTGLYLAVALFVLAVRVFCLLGNGR